MKEFTYLGKTVILLPGMRFSKIELISRLKHLNHNNFNQKVIERYKELRKTYFNPTSIFSRYESYYQILKQSGAAEREEQKWSGDSDVYGNEINFKKELDYIQNWINKRIAYLDKQFLYEDGTYIYNTSNQSDNQIIYSFVFIL